MQDLLFLILGIVGLLVGSGLIIDSLRKIAKAYKISELLIGLTIASIGTSLPEIATNISAGLKHSSGIAVGNIIGSCISNITLILGIVGLITIVFVSPRTFRREGIMLLGAIALMFAVSMTGLRILPLEGLFLVTVYIFYLIYLAKKEKVIEKIKEVGRPPEIRVGLELFLAVIGFAMLIYAAHLVVVGGVSLAKTLHVSEYLIGIFMVGIGTSLPELMISVQAVLKGAKGLSVGNLIGSNITAPLFALGLGSMFAGKGGFLVSPEILRFDMPILLFLTVLALLFLRGQRRFDRTKAAILLLLFGLYAYLKLFVI